MSVNENPYAPPFGMENRGNFFYWLQAAALGLIVISLLELATETLMLYFMTEELAAQQNIRLIEGDTPSISILNFVAAVACILRSLLVLIGASCMRLRRRYGLSLAGAILSIMGVVYPPLWFGIPFGIWALVILLQKQTRVAFTNASPTTRPPPHPVNPVHPV